MLNLDPKYLALIQKILAHHIPHAEVWAYGSRIKNTSHSGSDLDLVVISSVSQQQLSAVKNAISESNLPLLVDILEWEALPEAFHDEIQKAHEVISRSNLKA